MSEHVYFLTIGLPLAALLLIFGMKYYSAAVQARARLAHEDAYRQLAAQTATAQTQTAAALASIDATLADLRSRVAAVETILKAVE